MLLLIVAIIVGLVYSYNYIQNQKNIKKESILLVKFDSDISEKSQTVSEVESLTLGTQSAVSMREFFDLLDFAANDSKIKAISIDGTSAITHAKSMEVSRAIQKFQESGKPVYAYGKFYSQGAYAMAVSADSLFVNPMGYTDLKGYAMIRTYYKDLMEKFGIEMEVFVAGKYKSFVESYTRNESSAENKEQYTIYLNSLLSELINHVASHRNINVEAVADIVDQSLSYNATKSVEFDLIDQELHITDYYSFLKERTGIEEKNIVSLARYKQYMDYKKSHKKANVAYVVVDGEIRMSEGVSSAKNLRQSFKTIRENEDIHTVILRINSPGGSAFASEEIWNEIELLKEAGKEVISSISSVSASGGYYMMSNSDKIFCAPTSVTGSIGVFIAFPRYDKALEKNFDVHFDGIETGPFAKRTTGMAELTEGQRLQFQVITNELYDRFLKRVVDGRNLSRQHTENIAQGRIYTGADALDLKLVDSLLYLDEVFEYVKERNDSKKLVVQEFPDAKKSLLDDIKNLSSVKILGNTKSENIIIGELQKLEAIYLTNEPMARLPFHNLNN